MATEFRTPDAQEYRMVYHDPHRELEPVEEEIRIVGEALEYLCGLGIIPHTDYDPGKFLAHRRAVAETFEIPWTAITPRMQRLLYAVNAVARPGVMIAAGVFCGNTFISNAGAGTGPGACYRAGDLVGIEIEPDEAQRAERNVRRLDPTGVGRVVAADAIEWVKTYEDRIDLLYLDASDEKQRGKGIYLDILEACYDKLPRGGIVMAHNSVNNAETLAAYLETVRDPARFRASCNVIFDIEGLEVSAK